MGLPNDPSTEQDKCYFFFYRDNETEKKTPLEQYIVQNSYPTKDQRFFPDERAARHRYLNTAQTQDSTCYFIKVLGLSAKEATELMNTDNKPQGVSGKQAREQLLWQGRSKIQANIVGVTSTANSKEISLKI